MAQWIERRGSICGKLLDCQLAALVFPNGLSPNSVLRVRIVVDTLKGTLQCCCYSTKEGTNVKAQGKDCLCSKVQRLPGCGLVVAVIHFPRLLKKDVQDLDSIVVKKKRKFSLRNGAGLFSNIINGAESTTLTQNRSHQLAKVWS